MTKVKICGIKRMEDISYVNELKPEYIGFVFAKSKRKVEPFFAKQLKEKLDHNIQTVGVFVNETIERIITIYEEVGLDIVQLHGDETIEYIEQIPKHIKVWKAFRIQRKEDLEQVLFYKKHSHIDGVLLDAYHEKEYGGSGISFDWKYLQNFQGKDYILAGGLHSNNIETALQIASPSIVDISSGVEENGNKSYEKIKEFIEKVRKIK